MRLTPAQVQAIRAAAAEAFGDGAAVWLFGSRVDDTKRGGDIDLLVQPASGAQDQLFRRKVRLLARLERALGERKIDVVVEEPDDARPIVAIARQTGVRL
jgi:predicted nucleotidyltransferase